MSLRDGGRFGALLPLILSMISVCVGASFAKGLMPVAGAAGMTALRNGLAAILLATYQRPWRWRLDRTGWIAVTQYGVVLGCMNFCFYLSIRTVPLGLAVAIEFLGPLGVAIFYSARKLDFLWIACAAAGVACLVLPGSERAALDPTGVGFALAAALCWAFYIVTGKRVSEILPDGQAVCLGLCIAALITVPIGIFIAGPILFRPEIIGTGLIIATLASAVPFTLEMMALRRMPRHIFGVVLSLEPAIGALAGLAILGEHLLLLQWVAIIGVIIASVGVSLTHSPPAEQLIDA